MQLFCRSLFLIFLLPLSSLAQSNYKSGYVVTLKGDTLHGYIDQREWDTNPTSISFKSEPIGKVTEFTAHDISYFNVDNGFSIEYKRYGGSVTTDNIDDNHLSIGRDSSFRIDTVFLRVLQKGERIILFSYTDAIKTRFYISENPGTFPRELIYKTYFNSTESGTDKRTVNENSYKSQLYLMGVQFNAMNDNLKTNIEKSEYSEHDILSIVSRINGISADDFEKNHLAKPKVVKLTLALIGFVVIAIIVLSSKH